MRYELTILGAVRLRPLSRIITIKSMKNNKTKTLHVSDFHSLYEGQTILANYGMFYDDVRIVSYSGKCIKVVRRYQ